MSRVYPLKDNQARAVDPRRTVWLSASAGTGKTQVLSARVLRLLLQPGVEPEHLLCLTFTKAGAAEMATRVNEVLASWVRLPETALAEQLIAIGADYGPEALARARSRFAAVMDLRGDRGAAALLQSSDVQLVDVPGAGVDVDTDEDWQRLCAMAARKLE